MALPRRVVTLHDPGLRLPRSAPFAPPNDVSRAVERLFEALGFDAAHAGTPAWNPLGELARPGDRVVIKPNLVSSRNRHEKIAGQALLASSTHGSLLAAVLAWVARAVGPAGQIRVIDAPVEGCELALLLEELGVRVVIDEARARGVDVAFVDLRRSWIEPRMALDDVRWGAQSLNLGALVRRRLPGDPLGYRRVDLGERSWFARAGASPGEALRFHRSHPRGPVPHHTGGRHAYSLPQTLLDADLVIQLPKLKTHKKTGVTLGLKSVIGLTDQKTWLPHFTEGDPSRGGDELARALTLPERLETFLSRVPLPGGHSLVARAPRRGAAQPVIDGSWEGNDTLWRTILDLHHAVFHADRAGIVRERPVRRALTIVDGIVAGEGEGPLGATPVEAGLLVAGTDPPHVDAAAARLIGVDPARLPTIAHALASYPDPVPEVVHLGPPYERRFVTPRSWPSLTARAVPTGQDPE